MLTEHIVAQQSLHHLTSASTAVGSTSIPLHWDCSPQGSAGHAVCADMSVLTLLNTCLQRVTRLTTPLYGDASRHTLLTECRTCSLHTSVVGSRWSFGAICFWPLSHPVWSIRGISPCAHGLIVFLLYTADSLTLYRSSSSSLNSHSNNNVCVYQWRSSVQAIKPASAQYC